MKRRTLLAALALAACLPALPAQGADTLGAIAARLADAPVIRGRFEQQRQLAGFTNPLVSRGDFVLARERGLAWTTREPIVSSLVVTPTQLVVRGADGQVQQRLAADAQPAMRVVGESMIAVLRGDLSALSARFAIDARLAGKDGWALTLTPTDSGIRRAFARIELTGDRYVRSIRLEEAGGDATRIRLIEPVAAPRLSAAEAQRFE
ncbi:lipoprotein carrier protein LolA [Cupriavidus necator]|uniref:outer membrane lipoprotein carrier protein LolA n=1 Tax=Cupriavidus TaxID=106589 RepID=UPI00032F7A0E|nr:MULTISPECIES: outer membrane lipoprotein carrier protein LolA [Cupriavidus]EON20104.1 outer membrane lipoprotein carrier protein LolA [Cupriavidus sp. GA3-3]KUE84952.1 lipoprotein carrier protein LolA [Cupriavidus necator]